MKKNSFVHRMTKILVDIVFFGGIIALFFVPWFVNYWSNLFDYSKFIKIVLDIVLMTSGITALFLLWEVRSILKSIVQEDIFSEKTVKSLRRIAICTLVISIIYLIKQFFQFGIGTLVIVFAFLIATLIFLTIKDVFKQALIYKEENDWTV